MRHLHRDGRRAGLFPRQHHPGDRIDPARPGAAQSLPAAERHRSDRTNLYNYAYQTVQDWPRNDQVLRSTGTSGRARRCTGACNSATRSAPVPSRSFGFSGGWPQMASKFETETVSYVTTLLHTINPTTFLEATAGVNWGYQGASALDQAALDATTRPGCFQACLEFYPEANPSNLLPNATFNGGIPMSASAPIGSFLYETAGFPFTVTHAMDFCRAASPGS